MERIDTDYLLAIGLYSGGVTLDGLLAYTEPGGVIRPEARTKAQHTLAGMVKKGLVEEGDGAQGTGLFRLTKRGQKVSAAIADTLAAQMVDDWRTRQAAYTPSGAMAAGF